MRRPCSAALHPPRAAILVALLCLAAPARAQEEGVDADEPAAAPAAAPAPGSSPAPRMSIIVGYELRGTRFDPDEKLESLIASVAPLGSPFVESGAADQVGGVLIGTLPRTQRALEAAGYAATLSTRAGRGGLVLVADVRAYDRLRYIFVDGNGFKIRQDEVQRRVSIRAGHVLPPAGPDRAAALELERGHVIDFLRGEGFFDANVRIDAVPARGVRGAVDFYVHIARGPAFPLGPLKFTGNHVFSSEELDPLFRHRDWETAWIDPVPFSQKRMREDIEAVVKKYRAAGYVGARVTHDFNLQSSIDRQAKNVRLGLTINERKRIDIEFEGNAHKSAGTLKDRITMIERGSYDDYELGASADALQRYYQQEGFFFARVDWRRERLSADEERVTFVVDEGPELKVRGVEFVGNSVLPSSQLAEVVTVRTFPLLGYIGLGSGGYVTGRQLQTDAERLVEHYRAQGFPEATARGEAATSPEALGALGAIAAGAELDSREAKAVYVRFTIEEGPRVRVRSETFRNAEPGPLPYDQKYLLESVSLRPGEPFAPAMVRDDGRRLERALGDAGYPTGTAEPDAKRTGDDVDLTWVLKPGPRMRVGPTFVRGNFATKDQTVLEQIPLGTGSLLTTTATERGQRNLGFMQLFNNASPISFPGREEERPVVPMVVNVEERYEQYSVIHLGAGASTEQKDPNSSLPVGIYARAGYENRNLLGHAWGFTSNFAIGQSLRRGTATFLDPRFFGTLFRLDASLNYLQQATVRLGDIRSGGGSIGFSRELYPGVDAGIHYNLRNTTHTEDLIRGAGPDEDVTHLTLSTTVGSVSANVSWLRLDNRLLPTAGLRVDATAELAVPALSVPLRPLPFPTGDDSFLKLGVHVLSVVPLGRIFYLRIGFRFDDGLPLGGASLLPKVERYFAGGDTTIRGFNLDRARTEIVEYTLIPPAVPGGQSLVGVEYRPIGGNLRILQNIDLQFPISPPWYGSVFMDNGVVADSLQGLTPSQFRHGVGVSPFLLRLPIGDLSFAWAWPLDPRPGDTRIGVFHVNVGLLF
ncbi:MAG TPA: POTRA domain-containing protein [Polyangia bacterium]|nr:POTRA domain-containing protein [Polyangia bacterium]